MQPSDLSSSREAERKGTTITHLPSSNGWRQVQRRQSTALRTKANSLPISTNSKAWALRHATSEMLAAPKYSLNYLGCSRFGDSRWRRPLFLKTDVNPHKSLEKTMSDAILHNLLLLHICLFNNQLLPQDTREVAFNAPSLPSLISQGNGRGSIEAEAESVKKVRRREEAQKNH